MEHDEKSKEMIEKILGGLRDFLKERPPGEVLSLDDTGRKWLQDGIEFHYLRVLGKPKTKKTEPSKFRNI